MLSIIEVALDLLNEEALADVEQALQRWIERQAATVPPARGVDDAIESARRMKEFRAFVEVIGRKLSERGC